jgi:carboxylesterase type B
VTIFGESAGAFSVDALLTSYPKETIPPFRAAILQSGQISYGPPSIPSNSVASWYALSKSLNCSGESNLTCVRDSPATTIKSIIEHAALDFSPVPDNITLVSDPARRRLSGDIPIIPTISGSNSQEGRVFQLGVTNLTTFFQEYFPSAPDLWPILEAAYPAGRDGLNTPYDIASQIFTEFFFQCPEAQFANASAKSGIPTWRYYFNASFPNTQSFPGAGVFHASEIGIVFRTYPSLNLTAQEYALANYMQGAWAQFAKNPLGGPGWNAVGTGSDYFGGAEGEDLGALGDVGDVRTGGVTIIPQSVVDNRCSLFT